MSTVMFTTKPCPVCGNSSKLKLDKVSYDKWQSGTYVQVAFPRATSDEREMMLTGTHPFCWDERFGKDD